MDKIGSSKKCLAIPTASAWLQLARPNLNCGKTPNQQPGDLLETPTRFFSIFDEEQLILQGHIGSMT